jgi:hypothetical protein
MTVAELFARIGVKADSSQLNSFDKKLKGVKVAMTAAVAGAAVFSVAIRKITDDAMDAAAGMKQFEAETGASYQELQKWQSVAEQTNNSSKAITESIKNLASNREKIKVGEGDISGYQLLGIDPMQDPFEVLEDLRKQTADLPQAMKKNILGQMGISNDLLQVLELSNKEFTQMAGRAFIVPQSAIDGLDKARASLASVREAGSYLKTMIAAELAPGMEELNKKIIAFVKENEEGIVKGIKKSFEIIRDFVAAIGNAAMMINKIVTSTVGWKVALGGIAAAMAIFNAQLLLSPIGVFTAAIILLVLILDDLYMFSKGKGSLIGRMFGDSDLAGPWKALVDIISEFVNLLGLLATGDFAGVDALLASWGLVGDAIQRVIDLTKELAEINKKGQEQRNESFRGDTFQSDVAAAKDTERGLIDRFLSGLKASFAGQSLVAPGMAGGTMISTMNTSVNINTTGGVNGQDVAREIDRAARRGGYIE